MSFGNIEELDSEYARCMICKKMTAEHDRDLVLLCGPQGWTCPHEYHLYCLDPPLTAAPKRDWYCPSCNKNDVYDWLNKYIKTHDKRRENRKIQDKKQYRTWLKELHETCVPFDYWTPNVLSDKKVLPCEFESSSKELVGMWVRITCWRGAKAAVDSTRYVIDRGLICSRLED